MIPVPNFLVLPAIVAGGLLLFYEGLPFLLDGRVDRAYRLGEQAERILWEEQRRKDIALREAERRQAQQTIDRIEADYWRSKTEASLKIADLERELEKEPDNDRGTGCGPAISRGVSRALNAIGRGAATGEGATKP